MTAIGIAGAAGMGFAELTAIGIAGESAIDITGLKALGCAAIDIAELTAIGIAGAGKAHSDWHRWDRLQVCYGAGDSDSNHWYAKARHTFLHTAHVSSRLDRRRGQRKRRGAHWKRTATGAASN